MIGLLVAVAKQLIKRAETLSVAAAVVERKRREEILVHLLVMHHRLL